ncbi:MAG: N-acetyltransferase [Ruminococcus sp.]|nr:N-acetyltransferase [Ruminococcus sp.]
MIRLLTDERELDKSLLKQSLSGKKLLSYVKAYGMGYDFCRFYEVSDENGKGFMFIINSALIICADEKLEVTEELKMFVEMNLPFRIEGNQRILHGLSDSGHYQILNRTVFELVPDESTAKFCEQYVDFDPKLTEVYKILSEGFPNIADFSLWYTDTSHRCRHGISRVFTYKGCTTASAAFDIDNEVLIAQVATKIDSRGSGYAREFLKWLAEFFNNLGKRAYLLALDIRVSYYREIGFKEIEREIVLERKDIEKESVLKGKLADEQ